MAFVTPYITDRFAAYLRDSFSTRLTMAVRLVDEYANLKPLGRINVRIKNLEIDFTRNLSGYYLFTDLMAGKYILVIEPEYYFPQQRMVDTLKIKISDVTLNFFTTGPPAGATSIKLKDVSKLQVSDAVEFRKPAGIKEQRTLTGIKISTKEIFWAEGLTGDFNTPESTIVALKNPVVEVVLKPAPSYPFPDNATLVRGVIVWASGINRGLPVNGAKISVTGKTNETITDKKGEFVLYFRGIKQETISVEIKKNTLARTVTLTDKGEVVTVVEGKTLSVGLITFP